jgi:hypothetical protein
MNNTKFYIVHANITIRSANGLIKLDKYISSETKKINGFTTADPSGLAQQHQIHVSCVQTVPNLKPSRLYIVHSLLAPPTRINSARDSCL